MTVWRVMPFKKQSGVGVCSAPSGMTKNRLAPVASATWPRWSCMNASSYPAATASSRAIVQMTYRPAHFAAVGALSGLGRFHRLVFNLIDASP